MMRSRDHIGNLIHPHRLFYCPSAAAAHHCPSVSYPTLSSSSNLFPLSLSLSLCSSCFPKKSTMSDDVIQQRRPTGTTEHSWCRALPGGTGITVLALLLSKSPDFHSFQTALRKLQLSHPLLNSKLRFHPSSTSYSYVTTPPTDHHNPADIQIRRLDLHSTSQILRDHFPEEYDSIPHFHLILEHELNINSWQDADPSSDTHLFFATFYTLENDKWVAALRFHTSVCDRASALALLRELLEMDITTQGKGGEELDLQRKETEINLPIEELIPAGQGNKPFWARGMDVLGYSLNSFRLGNLNFKDTVSPRMSRVARLQMNAQDTSQIVSSCEHEKIKLSSLLAAAGLLSTHSLKGIPEGQWEKYAVVTLMDCRSILDPVLSSNQIGFYHSAILNSHDIMGGENLLELAKRVHDSFENAKNNKKHFTDIVDVNFLMCKAIENPGLTPSASLRTSLLSVFEESVMDHSNERHQIFGLEDFIGCASVHGIGPCMAIFDTIRDGKLDCACVFPFPLHSREQMQDLVDEMKRLLLEGTAK